MKIIFAIAMLIASVTVVTPAKAATYCNSYCNKGSCQTYCY